MAAICVLACGGSTPESDNRVGGGEEHAVLIHIPLAEDFGDSDMEALYSLEDELYEQLDGSDAGEFDGNEIGGGEWVLYLYGPDADVLVETILPTLESHDLPDGAYAIKRYGEPGAQQKRIEL